MSPAMPVGVRGREHVELHSTTEAGGDASMGSWSLLLNVIKGRCVLSYIRSANIFGKESDSKILSIVSVVTPQPCWYSTKVAKEKTERNGQGFIPIQLYKNRQRA